MAIFDHTRAVALILSEAAESLYNDILPIRGVANSWVLNGIDDDLPSDGDVKTTLEQYEAIKKPPITVYNAVQDVKASTGTPIEGLFSLPATVFPVDFSVDGPLFLENFKSQAFGVNLEIERMSLFCKDTGSGGDNLTVDLQDGSGSFFSTLPEITANSGNNQILLIPSANILRFTITAGETLTASVISKPDDCHTIALTIWVNVA